MEASGFNPEAAAEPSRPENETSPELGEERKEVALLEENVTSLKELLVVAESGDQLEPLLREINVAAE